MRDRDRHRGIRRRHKEEDVWRSQEPATEKELTRVKSWRQLPHGWTNTLRSLLGGPQYSLKRSPQRNTSQVSISMHVEAVLVGSGTAQATSRRESGQCWEQVHGLAKMDKGAEMVLD